MYHHGFAINCALVQGKGAAHSPISVAAYSSDKILPATLATLREINRKPIAESLDVEPEYDEIELRAHKSPWETDTSISYTPPKCSGNLNSNGVKKICVMNIRT